MTIDFETPMTCYELLAIILAIIAILIPIAQWIWKKWITKPILNHLITGKAFLYINIGGSYIKIEGVYTAQNKPILIRKISLKLIRKKDDKSLNLGWSNFFSPINQQYVGNFTFTTETAHPFRIEQNSVVTAFTEFEDLFDSAKRIFQPFYENLINKASEYASKGYNYEQALQEYTRANTYETARSALQKELFWEIGKYRATLQVDYDHKTTNFVYEFEVNAETSNLLSHNLSETLIVPLKDVYKVPYSFRSVQVELRDTTK